MYSFLKYHFKDKKDIYLLVFSTAYALSLYNIGNYFQIMWLDNMFLAPLILLGIDKIIDSKKPLLYGISLFLAILSNYYIGYMNCIFSVIYFIYRILINYNKKELKENIKIFLITSILAGMMTMWLNIPNIIATIGGARDLYIYMDTFNNDIFGLLSKLFIGSVTYDNFLNRTHALLYCGMFTIPLLLFYFMNKNINKREKILSGILLFIFIISILFNPINYTWHLFSPPNCFNARYAFLIILFVIYLSCRSFFEIKHITKIQALIIMPLIIIGLFVYLFSDLSIWYMYISVFLYLIYILIFLNFNNKDARILFIFLTLAELYFNLHIIFINYNKIMINNDYIEGRFYEKDETINYLENIDNSFYRLEFDETSYYNDSFYLDYKSVTTFLSTLNFDISLFKKIGYFSGNCYDHTTYPIMDALFGIKYYESLTEHNLYEEIYNHKISQIPILYGQVYSDGHLYYNKYALSLGYMVNSDAELNSDIFANQNALIKAMTSISDDVYIKNDVQYNDFIYTFEVVDDNDFYIEIDKEDYSSDYTYTVSVGGNLYSKTYHEANTLYVENNFNIGNIVEIKVNVQESDAKVNNVYVYSFDKEIFEKHINHLKENELNIEEYSDGYVKGNINVDDDKLLFLSIPYEKGWNIYVDGEKVDYNPIYNTFISFDLENGYHEIEMIYKASGLKLGIIVSSISTILFVGYMIYIYKKKNI